MSLLNTSTRDAAQQFRLDHQPAQRSGADLVEGFTSAWDYSTHLWWIASADRLKMRAFRDQTRKFEEETGQKIPFELFGTYAVNEKFGVERLEPGHMMARVTVFI
jgi:hypothetical protein